MLADEAAGQVHYVNKTEAISLPLPSSDLEPCGNILLPDLLKRWEASHAVIALGLEDLHGDAGKYLFPVLGTLTAAQMLTTELWQISVDAATARKLLDAQAHAAKSPRYRCYSAPNYFGSYGYGRYGHG